MPTRAELLAELRELKESSSSKARQRMNEILAIVLECKCRNCDKHYHELKARGDYKGFCSSKCQHERAKELGYRKSHNRSEYAVLDAAGEIGSVYVLR